MHPSLPQALQEMQSSNEGKVSTIDRSTDNHEVQQALANNPDISKERTNLLQGWSSMSSVLKTRIESMKRKARVAADVEEALGRCKDALSEYGNCVGVELPSSPAMEARQQEMLEALVCVCVCVCMCVYIKTATNFSHSPNCTTAARPTCITCQTC